MVRLLPTHASDQFCSIPLAIGLFVSVSAIVALCANHARKSSRKRDITHNIETFSSDSDKKFPPPSPLRSPRQLITTISSKTMSQFSMFNKKDKAAEEEFEAGGLWRKGILMGEKCQPPEFSGVIYYDNDGKRISELPPRSPRASPLLPTFSFPVVIKDSI